MSIHIHNDDQSATSEGTRTCRNNIRVDSLGGPASFFRLDTIYKPARYCCRLVFCNFRFPSVCSVASRYCIEATVAQGSSWFLAWRLPSTVLYPKEIRVGLPPKRGPTSDWRGLVYWDCPVGNTVQDLYRISPRQVDRVVDKTHWRSSLLTTLTTVAAPQLDRRSYTLTADIPAVYYTSVDRNAPTPLLRFVVDLL